MAQPGGEASARGLCPRPLRAAARPTSYLKPSSSTALAQEEEGEEDAGYVEVDMEDVTRRMQGAVDALHREFTAINAGRATPTMLDSIMVATSARTPSDP